MIQKIDATGHTDTSVKLILLLDVGWTHHNMAIDTLEYVYSSSLFGWNGNNCSVDNILVIRTEYQIFSFTWDYRKILYLKMKYF